MITIKESIAQIAVTESGVRESKPNGGPRIAEYQHATWLPVGPWPWCAAFVCWVVRKALAGREITFKRPETAGAWDLENWCKAQDNSVILKKPHKGDIQAGDILVYTFSHTGFALSAPDRDGNVKTCEGNTNGAGSREGDGVYIKSRHVSKIRSRIRFRD